MARHPDYYLSEFFYYKRSDNSGPYAYDGTTFTLQAGGGAGGGDASAANQVITNAALGVTTGAAVITDANGTIQQYLRGLVKRWVDALGAGTAAAALRVTLSSDGPFSTLTGAVTETAPASDTASSGLNGRLQRIAQNIATNAAAVSALATTMVLAAGTAIIGFVKLKDASGNDLTFTKSSATVGQNALSTAAEIVIAALATRMHAEITNDDAAIKVYWGQTSGVLTTTGHVIKPGATKNFDGYIGDIYCIAASGTPLVTFEEW